MFLKATGSNLGWAQTPFVRNAAGVLSYGTPENQGVIVGSSYFGSCGTPPYDEGATLTHEMVTSGAIRP